MTDRKGFYNSKYIRKTMAKFTGVYINPVRNGSLYKLDNKGQL